MKTILTGIAALCLTACATAPEVPLDTLSGTSWQLVQFQSSDDTIGTVIPPNLERYRMQFMADGTLSLQLDCNRANGRWAVTGTTTTGGNLSLKGGAMTRAMCTPGAIDIRVARDLDHIRTYTLKDGQLHLALQADGGIYSWIPVNHQTNTQTQ